MTTHETVRCDHATDNVPCCSACFHAEVYGVAKKAGLPDAISNAVADAAMIEAVDMGAFNEPNDI